LRLETRQQATPDAFSLTGRGNWWHHNRCLLLVLLLLLVDVPQLEMPVLMIYGIVQRRPSCW